MANDLIVIEKMETKLRARRPAEDNLFPLASNHRKELRKLRDDNISGLKTRLRNIRQIKEQEFFEKHKTRIEKEADKLLPIIAKLNKKYEIHLAMIQEGVNSIKELEESIDMGLICTSSDYNDISRLNNINTINCTRKYLRNDKAIKETLKRMFNEKFSERFSIIDDKISKMLTQYEEAINFGDLEAVKELYYSLKDADGFLNEVSNIKI